MNAFKRTLITIVSVVLLAACKDGTSGATGTAGPAAGPNHGNSGSVPSAPTSGDDSAPAGESPVSPNCVSNAYPTFTADVTDLSMIDVIVPPGTMHGSGSAVVGRTYIHPKGDIRESKTLVPIYAPVDGRVGAISYYIPPGAPEGYDAEYSLTFEVSCEVTIGFAHIKIVDDRLALAAGAEPSNSSASKSIAPISFRAGDIIGYWRGGLNSIAFDFLVNNTTVNNRFANPARYEADATRNYLDADCPYDYYPAQDRNRFYALFGSAAEGPIQGATCRSIVRDVPGTIAGQWFLSQDASLGTESVPNDGAWGGSIVIISDLSGNILLGNIGSVANRNHYQIQNAELPLPEQVSGEQCYPTSGTAGWVYVKLISNEEIHVAYSDRDGCPGVFPVESSRAYFR